MCGLVDAKETRTEGETMDSITILMPTSPIPSHPDTRIIDETIMTIRTHLPTAEIVIMIDGVREEQEEFRKNYIEYTRRLLWKCANEWTNVTPLLFEEHTHQAGMTRRALQLVNTPTILFVEHDTPITPDREIPFDHLIDVVKSGQANIVRLHHEALVLDAHRHLMIGEPESNLWATYQWSQRPHVASTGWYYQMLDSYFPPDAKTMIEDRIYGVLESAYRDQGKAGWDKFRVWLYYPDGDIKRSYHTDGREGQPKWEDTFGLE